MRKLFTPIGALLNYVIFPIIGILFLLTPFIGTTFVCLIVQESTQYTWSKNQSTGAVFLALIGQLGLSFGLLHLLGVSL